MGAVFNDVMHRLYGTNIWNDFSPTSSELEVQGWNGTHASLSRLMSSSGSNIVIDVGVWKGQSTLTMASGLRDNGIDGVVIAIDTFLGSPEHWFLTNRFFKRVNGLPDLYETFMSNVYRADLTNYVIPMAQTSSTAAKILRLAEVKASVIHVDAAHEYREALQDMEDYWEVLDTSGYLIGDDYHITWPGVVQAAGEFSAKVKRPLMVENPKFIIQK